MEIEEFLPLGKGRAGRKGSGKNGLGIGFFVGFFWSFLRIPRHFHGFSLVCELFMIFDPFGLTKIKPWRDDLQ